MVGQSHTRCFARGVNTFNDEGRTVPAGLALKSEGMMNFQMTKNYFAALACFRTWSLGLNSSPIIRHWSFFSDI
jgi:hypothetical protein